MQCKLNVAYSIVVIYLFIKFTFTLIFKIFPSKNIKNTKKYKNFFMITNAIAMYISMAGVLLDIVLLYTNIHQNSFTYLSLAINCNPLCHDLNS